MLGSGNTVWDPDGEYVDKVVIAEIYGSVWLGVLTFCSVQLSVKQWKEFASKKYFLRIKDATFSCQNKRKLISHAVSEMFKQLSMNNSKFNNIILLSIRLCL